MLSKCKCKKNIPIIYVSFRVLSHDAPAFDNE